VTVVWYTTAQVAERWQTSQDEVRKLIRSRRLGAMRLKRASKRPTYRVSETHLAEYERAQELRAR